ncbi:MAG: hypothetical protein J6B87_06445 [Clostridia bacterium]|nr:hypothetical protein [Clostridia bacterium]
MKKKKIKLNYKVIARNIIILIFAFFAISTLKDLAKYPELYSTTLRYQLKNDIEQGEAIAITYYNSNYLANNIQLFD